MEHRSLNTTDAASKNISKSHTPVELLIPLRMTMGPRLANDFHRTNFVLTRRVMMLNSPRELMELIKLRQRSTQANLLFTNTFHDEDIIGINVGGRLSGDVEFEFYGPLKPRIIEELPDRLRFFVVPENNFGIAAKKRVRTLPLVINTNGQDVTFTPIIDGVPDTPTIFNTPSKRTVLHYFVDDVFGIDFRGELSGANPFDFVWNA